MNTSCAQYTAPGPEPVQFKTLFRAATNALHQFLGRFKTQPQMNKADLIALDGLSAEVLKDIGAPEWMQDRVHRAAERAHQGGLLERDSLHWR